MRADRERHNARKIVFMEFSFLSVMPHCRVLLGRLDPLPCGPVNLEEDSSDTKQFFAPM
jgi:hypothetical protein|tara:strand:- start:111 stop:287 length:177 start_codon:yes stop_codon:yes gene_type:complete